MLKDRINREEAKQQMLILVDEKDHNVGSGEKIRIHKEGLLHRAFSIFVFRQVAQKTELLMQQRQFDKYHSGGLWSNTCCGHAVVNNNLREVAMQRLSEEFGFKLSLRGVSSFHYKHHFANGMIENEIDHIFIGWYKEEVIDPNDKEIAKFDWVSLDNIYKIVKTDITPWFFEAFNLALNHL